MATEYIVVDADDAELAREAIGRLFLLPSTNGFGEWPVPALLPTKYYVDPRISANGLLAALGPRDSFLESVLGKRVECTNAPYELPSQFTALEDDWFPQAESRRAEDA